MATSSPNLPRIVHVGPGLAVRGGVSAVERLIIDSISRHVQVEHVATAEEGGILRRMRVFGAALWRIHSILGQGPVRSFTCTSPRVEAHSASASSP